MAGQNETRDATAKVPTIEVGGLPFGAIKLDEAVELLIRRSVDGRPGISVRLANAYCVALAASDESYKRLMVDHGFNLPDGTPVAVVMRGLARSNGQLRETIGRVRGPSFFEATLDRGRSESLRHFFLGTTSETLSKLTKQLELKYPGIQIAGSFAPPFAPLDDQYVVDCAARVMASGANIVWVGVGTPKQDFLSTRLAEATNLCCVGVGAAFDFTAGTAQEAPKWIQNSGFEWLYRLAREPKRLWRRYLIGNFTFVRSVLSSIPLSR